MLFARSLTAFTLAVTCSCSDSSGVPDAAPDAFDWGEVDVLGRVCVVLDLRVPYSCLPGQSVSDFQVRELESGVEVQTADDGSFGLDLPDGDREVQLRAEREGRKVALTWAPSADLQTVTIPSIPLPTWQSYSDVLGLSDDPDAATMLVRVMSDGEPVSDSIIVPPAGSTAVYYNLGDPYDWEPVGQTAANGIAIVTGVPVDEDGSVSFVVRGPDDRAVVTLPAVAVEVAALTAITVELEL